MQDSHESSISLEERQRWLAVMERMLGIGLPQRMPPQMAPDPQPTARAKVLELRRA